MRVMIQGMSNKKKPGPPADPNSKRSQGVDRRADRRIPVPIPQPIFDRLDRYCDAQRYRPTYSQVLLRALEELLDREQPNPTAEQ